ncbi:MAG: family 43 glycosylhydrolase, partial [Acetanaerobacterium sp.]
MIQNPILPGFNPDPSIIRTGEDYYLVTSSFEWFPGVPLYHSRDLDHWELVDYLLKTKEYLDLTGAKPSRGVWAPGLSYCAQEKRFYLIYSNVHNQNKWMFDVDNYMIWTDDIRGEWSKPAYLNSSGFDPSLFHDDDGRKWLINKDRDFRPVNVDHRAIVIQELDAKEMKLIGTPVVISRGA